MVENRRPFEPDPDNAGGGKDAQYSDLSKILQFVRNMKPGDHGVFFYGSPHEKREVLFNFLEAGIQKREKAVYVAAQETSKRIRKHMEDFGLNVKVLERDGVLKIFGCDGWYVVDGEVNVAHAKMMGDRVFDEAMEIGLKGLRGCGEPACFFEHKKEKELMDYELEIGGKLDLPITALCAYDVNHAKSLEEKLFFSLIKAHGPVVTSTFAREVKFENFFPTIMREVLDTVFGEMGEEIILRMLEEHYPIRPFVRVGEDPESFVEGLEELIGSGAQTITNLVVRQMHSKIGITYGEVDIRHAL